MPTNELSDALNPYASQPISHRNTSPSFSPSSSGSPSTSPAQVPYRSELEGAITEAPHPAVSQQSSAPPIYDDNAASGLLQQLVQVINTSRKEQEAERQRRMEWEREQEMICAQRQAEFDRTLWDMRSEISSLRAMIGMNATPIQSSSSLGQVLSPVSLASHHEEQGSPYLDVGSHQPGGYHGGVSSAHQNATQASVSYGMQSVTNTITPSPSPQFTHTSVPSLSRKRIQRVPPDNEEAEERSSDGSSDESFRPQRSSKRRNHHDKQCYTIHHAMRIHIVRLMGIANDKQLPDSHDEGEELSPTDPVRFVWEKTPRQSAHNARMRSRVIDDLKRNRKLYKHVPEKDFKQAVLEAAFDQCYTTLRQKFRSQRDVSIAQHEKAREDIKAMKSRRLLRKKYKLGCRSEARAQIEEYSKPAFDGAFQIDCISSEESDPEDPNTILRCGLQWRSSRLICFYTALDMAGQPGSGRPTGGLRKKDRQFGSARDEFVMPPNGVASWMISKHWLAGPWKIRPDLPDCVSQLVDDSADLNWSQYPELGVESDDECPSSPVNR